MYSETTHTTAQTGLNCEVVLFVRLLNMLNVENSVLVMLGCGLYSEGS